MTRKSTKRSARAKPTDLWRRRAARTAALGVLIASLSMGGTSQHIFEQLPPPLAELLTIGAADASGSCRTEDHYHAVIGEAHYTSLWKYARSVSLKTKKVTRYKIYRTIAVTNDGWTYILGYCWVKY